MPGVLEDFEAVVYNVFQFLSQVYGKRYLEARTPQDRQRIVNILLSFVLDLDSISDNEPLLKELITALEKLKVELIKEEQPFH